MKCYLLSSVLPHDPHNGHDLRFIHLLPFLDEVFFVARREYGASGKKLDAGSAWKATQLDDLSGVRQHISRCEGGVWIAGDYAAFRMLESLRIQPVVYDGCDSQSLYFRRRFHHLPFWRFIKRLNALRWYLIWSRRERAISSYCNGVVVPASADGKAFKRWGCRRVGMVSNGTRWVSEPPIERIPEARAMMFHGAFSWPVNLSTAEYLVNRVFPEVRKLAPDVRLRIAGHPVPESLQQIDPEGGVSMEGYVEDIRGWLSNCAVYVMPMLQGGGVKNKLLEVMALGVPAITNSLGAEAMDAEARHCFVVADGPRNIAAAAVRLVRNPAEGRVLADRARAYALEHFEWANLSDQYRSFLVDIASEAGLEVSP